MSAVSFTGRSRTAALGLLADTPLGEALERCGQTEDVSWQEGSFTIAYLELHLYAIASLSTGEQHLWAFLVSLAGQGTVNVGDLLAAVDTDCQAAVVRALGTAVGVSVGTGARA